MSISIDPRAAVSPKARLGTNVSIGPGTVVEDGAVIGDGSTVGANALIGLGARIGRDCRIHHGAVIGHAPQDLKYADEPTTCEIGDRTIVREYAVLHRGTGEGGRTVVGSDGFYMAFTHIAHDCVLGDHVIMANASMLAGHIHVEDWVTIGGITPVHQFVRIGQHAMIGGGLRVHKDVPPYILAGGEPLVFEGLNSIGLRRRGFAPEVISALDRAYAVIYRSGLNVSQAVARIREDASLLAFHEVRNVIEFIGKSKRGILPPFRLRH
ncbi:MAG TPA: acyl-ACP--UDP-N-acetylglucosamine O-acyltransferase [Bacteroidota bacterium]|nr:acyl-ACP--UDP-N-acetylglucosamine O-acyltransferase [Bacteroidota bacterium]